MLTGLTAVHMAGAIITMLAALLALLKPCKKWCSLLWKKTLGRNGVKIDLILGELTPNGGTSLKDAVVRIEERQHGMDAFFRAQLNLHNVAIVRTDAEGKLTAINRQYQRMTGYSLIEVEGDGWINAIHPEDRQKVKDQWDEAIASGREMTEDMRFLTALGETIMAHASVFREIDVDGNIRGYLGTITPVLPELNEDCQEALDWVRNEKNRREESDTQDTGIVTKP